MSVIAFDLIGEKRGGSRANNLVRSYTKVWRAQTDDRRDGPAQIFAYASMPVQYVTTYASGNDSDDQARCVSIQVDEEGTSGKSWIVTADFSTNAPVELDPNPLLDPVRYQLSFDQFTTPARNAIDFFGDQNKRVPISNTRGQVLRPFVEADECRVAYVVQRNEVFINVPLVMDMVNSVNIAAWKGAGPRCVKCKSITTGEIQQRAGISYYPVTYEFHLNSDTWDLRPLNQATQFKSPAGIVQSLDVGMDPVTIYTGQDTGGNPQRGEGQLVYPSDSPTIDNVYLRYRYYKERNFTIFNF